MTGVDAHGLLREQIADVLLLRGGMGSWMPGQIDVVLDDLVVFVEAAIAAAEMRFADEVHAQHREALAAARRDALTAAADEMFAEVEGGPGLLRPEVQAWLRQRAAEVTAGQRHPHPRGEVVKAEEWPARWCCEHWEDGFEVCCICGCSRMDGEYPTDCCGPPPVPVTPEEPLPAETGDST